MLAAGKLLMRAEKTYFVYIMTNRSKTLYTGLTNSLVRRVREHKLGIGSGFTAKYRLDRLVYYECFQDVHNAIEREKEIKGWLRIKKIALIVSVNPAWRDLSLEWYERHPFQPQPRAEADRISSPDPRPLSS
jgi:putative endonuclease